ncbi:MAG: hypothetical protein ABI041_06565, partial [Bdellovibrionia bacterium]
MAGSNKNKLTMLLGSFYILFGTMESMATNIPLPQLSSLSIATSCSPSRGMLLWTTKSLLSNPAEQDQLISLSLSSKITDIYAYLVKSDYSTFQEQLQTFNSKLNNAGIKIWGMEGYRGYFSDAYGPSELYAAANALSTFNSKVNSNSRFAGFYMNMQPQDGQGDEFKTTFHNDLCDSNLDPVSGGVWFDSELKDREMLMRDWLLIAQSLRQKMNEAGLRLGAAMPSWTDDYYDEEILVSFNGIRQGLMKHMMQILNDYVVMSYNTNPRNAANRLKGELAYADTLPVSNRPRVFGGLETHPGSGMNVSYADTAGKNNRTTVIQDIQTIQEILGEHDSFCGINLSDW